MQKALHPFTNKLISYKEYKEFSLTNNYTTLNVTPKTTCPVCHNDLNARAGQKQDNGHFAHQTNDVCPTKEPAARPYLGLTEFPVDATIVNANKDFTKNNIEAIFSEISNIAIYLDLKEFISILKEAKRLNIYKYVNLVPEYIPYVLVTLINFLPKNSYQKKRNLKFMFFYENHIQNFEDLWINNGINSKLYRISYDGSTTKKVTLIPTNTIYLTSITRTLSQKQKEWCIKEL